MEQFIEWLYPAFKRHTTGRIAIFFPFNQKIIDILNCAVGGILINDVPYNIFCYADVLVLTSIRIDRTQEAD